MITQKRKKEVTMKGQNLDKKAYTYFCFCWGVSIMSLFCVSECECGSELFIVVLDSTRLHNAQACIDLGVIVFDFFFYQFVLYNIEKSIWVKTNVQFFFMKLADESHVQNTTISSNRLPNLVGLHFVFHKVSRDLFFI